MTTITGRFDLTRWDEEVYDDTEGVKLQTVSLAKDFEGGISGTSTGRLIQAFSPDGSAPTSASSGSPPTSTAARARSCCGTPPWAVRPGAR